MAGDTLGSPGCAVVTGAAGFIGSHLVARLVGLGWRVVGIDDERSGDWSRASDACTRVPQDLVTMPSGDLESALAGADVCFHLAAEKYNSSRTTPERVIDVNIHGMHRLLDASVRVGVSKVVFTSSLYVYGSLGPCPMSERDLPMPTTLYGMSKVAGEHLLRVAARDSGLDSSVARLFFVYGPRQYAEGGYKSVIVANLERLRHDERPIVYGDGKQMLDYVYVDDAVEALVMLADHAHDGLVCNVGSGRAVSVADLTDIMLEVSGRDLEPVMCPPDWTAGSVRVAETGLARKALGWTAATRVEDGVRRVWESLVTAHG